MVLKSKDYILKNKCYNLYNKSLDDPMYCQNEKLWQN